MHLYRKNISCNVVPEYSHVHDLKCAWFHEAGHTRLNYIYLRSNLVPGQYIALNARRPDELWLVICLQYALINPHWNAANHSQSYWIQVLTVFEMLLGKLTPCTTNIFQISNSKYVQTSSFLCWRRYSSVGCYLKIWVDKKISHAGVGSGLGLGL